MFKNILAFSALAPLAFGAAAPAQAKALVAYYSAHGGYTAQVAKTVAQAVGADLFVIKPDPDYTDADLDYNDPQSRVSREHADPSSWEKIPLKQTEPDNFAEYDTVYLGYPIWWGLAAWPVYSFVAGNDFAGKTIIPFATSYSSPLGTSDVELEQKAKGGYWEEGMRFGQTPSESEVTEWAKSY